MRKILLTVDYSIVSSLKCFFDPEYISSSQSHWIRKESYVQCSPSSYLVEATHSLIVLTLTEDTVLVKHLTEF